MHEALFQKWVCGLELNKQSHTVSLHSSWEARQSTKHHMLWKQVKIQGGKIKQKNQVECNRKGAVFRWNQGESQSEKWRWSRDLNESKSELYRYVREEHSRTKDQHVQRPWKRSQCVTGSKEDTGRGWGSQGLCNPRQKLCSNIFLSEVENIKVSWTGNDIIWLTFWVSFRCCEGKSCRRLGRWHFRW